MRPQNQPPRTPTTRRDGAGIGTSLQQTVVRPLRPLARAKPPCRWRLSERVRPPPTASRHLAQASTPIVHTRSFKCRELPPAASQVARTRAAANPFNPAHTRTHRLDWPLRERLHTSPIVLLVLQVAVASDLGARGLHLHSSARCKKHAVCLNARGPGGSSTPWRSKRKNQHEARVEPASAAPGRESDRGGGGHTSNRRGRMARAPRRAPAQA